MTARDGTRFRELVDTDPRLAISLVQKHVPDAASSGDAKIHLASGVPPSALVIARVAFAEEALRVGGFARLERLLPDETQALLTALCTIGAHDGASVVSLMNHLARSDKDLDQELHELELQYLDHEPPVLGLLIDYAASLDSPWFEEIVNIQGVTPQANLEQALFDAIAIGHRPLVARALEGGASATVTRPDGTSALHIAVKARPTPSRVAVAALLVESGAPLDLPDGQGRTPLHDAAAAGGVRFVELLLASGANPGISCRAGTTPLHWAADDQTTRLLLGAGADVNVRTTSGLTPLHFSGPASKVRVLLDSGADPLARACDGASTLHHTVDGETVDLLVAAGVDPNAIDNGGCTPLMAQHSGGAVEALLAHGARIDAVDARGRGVLHYHHSSPCLELLLSRGADPLRQDADGRTALELAREKDWYGGRYVAILADAVAAQRRAPVAQ